MTVQAPQHIVEKARAVGHAYIAKDANGSWYGYSEKPHRINNGNSWHARDFTLLGFTGPDDWQNSCQPVPKEEPKPTLPLSFLVTASSSMRVTKHSTLEEARTEAAQLARTRPDDVIHIMRTIQTAKVTDVTFSDLLA